MEVEGKQNLLFPGEPVMKCFVIHVPPKYKVESKTAESLLLNANRHTNLSQCQGAKPDHVQVESSRCCFPTELVSFVRPLMLLLKTYPR